MTDVASIFPTSLRTRSAILFFAIATFAALQAVVGWSLAVDARAFGPWRGYGQILLLALAAAIITLSLIASICTWRRVVVPLAAVTEAVQHLARGETEHRLEIGACADVVAELAEACENLRLVIVDHVADERMIAESNAAQSRIVQLLGDGLSKIAQKDLTCRLTETVPYTYRGLQIDFNTAVEQLSQAIADVAESTQVLGAGMRETVAAADDLSRRAERHAANLEQTAASLADITGTVGRTAEDAEKARKIVAGASRDAEKSGVIVSHAIGAMGDIDRSSRKIGQIIGVIDSIATQTNLLALNAGVEAARAGDAGRGFAVVAAEIRDLARRCAKAAKEIEDLISASNAQIERGVTLVGETGAALSRIVEQIAKVNDVVAEIADRARLQAANLTEVNAAVGQMDQFTQQNAAMAEQTTAVNHRLGEETTELIELMSRFRIDARVGPASIRPERRRSVVVGGRVASVATPAPLPPAEKNAGDASDIDWIEF
ncbi:MULTISPECIES: methyl-accepting chemotaxis protein [Methylosinus]|uniref:Methyl-accepting chemotaxis protein n=1 Tax=Methylosinus trichosporium (strain ATCC 35070 / NCIMB 11131 / UNIQEM 75 / OB3b) TaxID=595536 RepID=A0A2D2D667_METT3|nr:MULTISPECIES: methyl-accepting chemotaxis protein [Methylosinus]ATQ70507.1 methyl-accepting chemotaxis protein [Methylosinus trichosporium OB3b]